MLDPENDDSIAKEINPDEDATKAPKAGHFHKTISSIFGQAPSFKSQKEVAETTHHKSGFLHSLEMAIFKILLLISIGVCIFFYYKSVQESGRRISMEGRLTELKAEVAMLRASIDSMAEVLNASDQSRDEYEQLKAGTEDLNKKIEVLSQEKSNLEIALKEKDFKIEELVTQLVSLGQKKTVLGKRLGLSRKAAAPAPDAAKRTITVEAVKMSGKILVVKPATDIAVINLGQSDGVTAGSMFEIYTTGNDYVADFIIDEVEETVSLGKIVPQVFSGRVKENYIVQEK